MTLSQDKRREERIRLEAPVLLASGTGISRDISNSGIYFLTEQSLPLGGAVNFSVQLDYACPGKPLKLECRGEVLRVEEAGAQFGVAASISECWCTH
jgi:hypothetical protein